MPKKQEYFKKRYQKDDPVIIVHRLDPTRHLTDLVLYIHTCTCHLLLLLIELGLNLAALRRRHTVAARAGPAYVVGGGRCCLRRNCRR